MLSAVVGLPESAAARSARENAPQSSLHRTKSGGGERCRAVQIAGPDRNRRRRPMRAEAMRRDEAATAQSAERDPRTKLSGQGEPRASQREAMGPAEQGGLGSEAARDGRWGAVFCCHVLREKPESFRAAFVKQIAFGLNVSYICCS